MARISKIKMKGKERQNNPSPAHGIYNMGGFLIDPPEECRYKAKPKGGGTWADFGCCIGICKEKCQRYKSYLKMRPGEYLEELRRKGVKNI